ncbi:MAG: hypothetical protein GX799_09780 [Crenarchaeota archaeon]|jgi:hypothetical protein|nr:hypothetical protein [Thermoproteota archaeon]
MNNKYDISNIKLNDKYLTDPILLALAWKRAHNYVRSFNWYADNFELDKSSLFLQKKCKEWVKELELESGEINLKPLELVPAPKTHTWEFIKPSLESESQDKECLIWQPQESTAELSLRPLAHIGIKEQTYFTLLMSCLANIVETKQGDPSTAFDEVHAKQVVSYGNRLYCTYENGKAEHNYGSAILYSKYFADYRVFLQRPYYFAQQENFEKSQGEDIYIVELDLKQFFDTINREKLIQKIENLIKEQNPLQSKEGNKKSTTILLESFKNWEWSDDAKKDAIFFSGKSGSQSRDELPKGIPQGLVAGGFLANIYLLEIDKIMSSILNQTYKQDDVENSKKSEEIDSILQALYDQNIKINDYCRYVDDIRLVISAPKLSRDYSLQQLTKTIVRLATIFLKTKRLNLKINKDKTKVTPYHSKPKGISSQTNIIQEQMSGPLGPEHIDNLINEIESLLDLNMTENPFQDKDSCKLNKLAEIERSSFDVREDTLRRFAANKLAKALKEKRHFTSRKVDAQGNPIAGEWDYLQERIARKFIAIWSREPSLVLLLKKGLELFPSARTLEPILDQLKEIGSRDEKQKAVANYCFAEIFRHSATVIHKKDLHAIPAHADVSSFFEVLQDHAAKCISPQGQQNNEWSFVEEQARFLLLVRIDTTLEESTGDAQQDLIFKLLKGYRTITTQLTLDEISLCILLANQLSDDKHMLLRSTVELISNLRSGIANDKLSLLTAIATQNLDLVSEIIQQARLLRKSWVFTDDIKTLTEKIYLDIRPSKKPLDQIKTSQGLVQLITRPDNPFANEIMAIKLMQALIISYESQQLELEDKQIDLAATTVIFKSGYKEIPLYQSFEEQLIVELKTQDALTTDYLTNFLNTEELALRKIAFVIRAALAGSKDVTGFGVSYPPKVGYRGLKSTHMKRQIGLYTTPESLAGKGAQTSGWLTTLLTKLLRWPGIRVNEQGYNWPTKFGLSEVKELLEKRLKELKSVYCQLSQMPALPELISPKWKKDKTNLNVVMVQSKLPTQKDFISDLYLNDLQFRSQHRSHIASVAKLAVEHIKTSEIEPDLIIWPELAVHEEDLDVLKLLSQKTHAIIFAGLGFLQNENGSPINTAIWIVPRKHNGNNNEIMRLQGKYHMTALERGKVQSWRPYQLMLELCHPNFPTQKGFTLTGAICYDATDIKLSADLSDKSNVFVIAALNKDVNTFDSMVEALHYHMYQPVVLVNSGEFGGSYAMAPYKEHHEKLIAHNTGKNQVAISSFSLNMFDFRRDGVGRSMRSKNQIKTQPAGITLK